MLASAPDEWPFYFLEEDSGALRSTAVNLSLSSPAPQQRRPYLQFVWVGMLMPLPNGLRSEAETAQLDAIERVVVDFLQTEFDAEYVAQLNREGRFEMWFYAGRTDADLTWRIAPVMASFSGYRFMAGSDPDPDWTGYLHEFYPNDPKCLAQIVNFRQIERLRELGDSLSAPRPVDHTLYFSSAESRAAFIGLALEAGFERVSEFEKSPQTGGAMYRVALQKTSHIDLMTINEVVWQLMDLAAPHGGEYDGWGTLVQKK
jgi:regulator of RNase E activity RraB